MCWLMRSQDYNYKMKQGRYIWNSCNSVICLIHDASMPGVNSKQTNVVTVAEKGQSNQGPKFLKA